jgi:hypothetical protein
MLRVTAEEKVSCRKFTLTLLLCMLPSLPNTTQPMLANKKFRPYSRSDPKSKYYLSAEKEKTNTLKVQTPKNVQINKAKTHFELPNPNARA